MRRTDKFMIVVFILSLCGMSFLLGGEVLKEDAKPYQEDIESLINLVVEIGTPETFDETYEVLNNLKSPSDTMIEVQETVTIVVGDAE